MDEAHDRHVPRLDRVLREALQRSDRGGRRADRRQGADGRVHRRGDRARSSAARRRRCSSSRSSTAAPGEMIAKEAEIPLGELDPIGGVAGPRQLRDAAAVEHRSAREGPQVSDPTTASLPPRSTRSQRRAERADARRRRGPDPCAAARARRRGRHDHDPGQDRSSTTSASGSRRASSCACADRTARARARCSRRSWA